MIRSARVVAVAGVCAAAAGAPTSTGAADAARRAPIVDQMVVFRSGKARERHVSTQAVTVRVGRRRCAVGAGTALAALVRARVGRVRLRDFGSCSRRPRDAGALLVTAIGPDRNRGRKGWVYKVGRKAATAGAGDPSGPFGRGRLRSGQRIVWFYCLRATDCQRTLSLRRRVEAGRTVRVRVVGYDDAGRGVAVARARVRLGGFVGSTDPSGLARFTVPPGTYRLYARKKGLVRSFPERVVVR